MKLNKIPSFLLVIGLIAIGSRIVGAMTVNETSKIEDITLQDNIDQKEPSEENDPVDKERKPEPKDTDETEGMKASAAALPAIETPGFNLYRGEEIDGSHYIGNYGSWADIMQAIKDDAVEPGPYAIDLRDQDLSVKVNWGTDLTTGSDQYFLHFYSTTYEDTGRGTVILPQNSMMGAHVRFHSGVGLQTPDSVNRGKMPLTSRTLIGYADVMGYNAANCGNIYANGWRFIVDKGVDVKGFAQLYASGGSTAVTNTFNFINGKTILEEEGGIQAGYLEINSGEWRFLAGFISGATGAYRIKVGTDDDPANPVKVDLVIGSVYGVALSAVNYMAPVTPDPDIPTEYIEVSGNTTITYGVAMMPGGTRRYNPDNPSRVYSTQKVKLSGQATILSTMGGVTPETLSSLTAFDKNRYNRISVSAGSSADGFYHFNNYNKNEVVNIMVEISDDVYIAGDVIANGPNMYFNVNNESKGTHISIRDRAQIGGNIVYGGSSFANAVTPADSPDNPFFSIHVEGTAENSGVKIGGSILASNGEDRSNASSWCVSTKVINAVINGSVFGYGNLSNQFSNTGIAIKNAEILVENSIVGGGIYGIATGSGTTAATRGSAKKCRITINNSTVGHVAPFFTLKTYSGGGGATTGYNIGASEINIKDSTVTGRTVMWLSGDAYYDNINLSLYAFIGRDENGNIDQYAKAIAGIEIAADGTRTINFDTDKYTGIPLETHQPDISLTTSMETTLSEMKLANYSISLAKTPDFPGIHKVNIENTDFSRENGNPLIVIMDTGDGTLGTSAGIIIDNCYATATGKKLDVAVFGEVPNANVTADKVQEMSVKVNNTNDIGNAGFINSDSQYFINTKASITLRNIVADALFGKKNSTRPLRNVPGGNRIQFVFQQDNTIGEILANGADIVFDENSVTYISGRFNNTGGASGDTVYDNEWVDVKHNSHVYLGNGGIPADKDNLGDAMTQRIFGSIQGANGDLYIYKDISNIDAVPNATYPIYVAKNGIIMSSGMNLGEWEADEGTLTTTDKETILDAQQGAGRIFKIQEPQTSKYYVGIQKEHDVLMAFETTANAQPELLNNIPLRPWPIINYLKEDGTKNGWLVLGEPRYQLLYQGTGYLENTNQEVTGKAHFSGEVSDTIIRPAADGYQPAADLYTIEAVTAMPDNPGYEFLYWKLFSTAEREDAEGNLIRNDWVAKTEVINDNPPSAEELPGVKIPENGKIWITGNPISLLEFIKNQKILKNESEKLMLIPVYKANYKCKIGDKGYLTLADAFAEIDSAAAEPEPDGSYKIEMLVESYEIDAEYTITDGRQVLITTASADDEVLPYLGEAETVCELKRQYLDESSYKGTFFKVKGPSGSLTIQNLKLDGNKGQVTSEEALIMLEESAALNLLSNSLLVNNKTINVGAAIQGAGNNPILLQDTVVSDNISLQAGGGGIVSEGVSNITLSGNLIVVNNGIDKGEETEAANICLEAQGKVRILGSLSDNSNVGIKVAEANHIYGYVFAIAESEADAKASYPFLIDDYGEKINISIDPQNPRQILFVNAERFVFTKVKAEDTAKLLNGAEFKLFKLICTSSEHNHMLTTDLVDQKSIENGCWTQATTDISGGEGKADGVVDMGYLEEGVYMLAETQAVSGYQLPEGQWMVEIKPLQSDKITITAHGKSEKMPPAFMVLSQEDGTIQYKLPNIKLLKLPLAGQPGIYLLVIVGVTIVSITFLLIYLRKRGDYKLISS